MVDMGTNSTRLLVGDVEDGEVKELERRSTVTRLGRGVDTSRQLATEAIEDVVSAVGEYIKLYEPLEPDVVLALATSAVRDAENSGAFIAELRERYALNARILTGEEEARLTYVGAVAGTPTSLAAIDQELDPYDPERVHGYVLSLDAIQHMYSMLSGKSLEERLKVPGLHPGRAPTIVAGVVILIQAMRAFGLQEIEVSEHDILYGAALKAAGSP